MGLLTGTGEDLLSLSALVARAVLSRSLASDVVEFISRRFDNPPPSLLVNRTPLILEAPP
jgi:hypothetical protein